MAASTLLKSCAMPPASWPIASIRCACAGCLRLLAQCQLTLKLGERSQKGLVRLCPLNRRPVQRVLQLQNLGRRHGNQFDGRHGRVGKRLAQLTDRPRNLSGQAPGEQEARSRKASAQHHRPAHRIPNRRLHLCLLIPTSTLHALRDDCALAANERIPLAGGVLGQPRPIFGGAQPRRGELADLGVWNARDEPAFAIDDGGKPVPRDIVDTEEVKEFSGPHGDSESTRAGHP